MQANKIEESRKSIEKRIADIETSLVGLKESKNRLFKDLSSRKNAHKEHNDQLEASRSKLNQVQQAAALHLSESNTMMLYSMMLYSMMTYSMCVIFVAP